MSRSLSSFSLSFFPSIIGLMVFFIHRSQMRAPIQTLNDAKDSITSVVIQDATITTGSVDGFVRTYDLRMGQLQSDYMGREHCSYISRSLRICG